MTAPLSPLLVGLDFWYGSRCELNAIAGPIQKYRRYHRLIVASASFCFDKRVIRIQICISKLPKPFGGKCMSTKTDTAIDARFSNPLDVVPNEIPFDVPYGLPISLDRAQAAIHAAVAEAKKRNWKMNIAVA